VTDRIKTARLCLIVAGFLSVATAGLVLLIFILGAVYVGWGGDRSRLLGSGLLGGLGVGLFIAAMALGTVDFLAAAAVSKKKRWGRVMGTVLGAVWVPFFPVGTILGLFILTGLIGAEADAWFRDIGARGTLRPGPSGSSDRLPGL